MLSNTYFSQWEDAQLILKQIADKYPEDHDWKPQPDMNSLGTIAKHAVLVNYHILLNYAKIKTPDPPRDLLDKESWNKDDLKKGIFLTDDLVRKYLTTLNDSDLDQEAYRWKFDDGKEVIYPIAWVVNQFKVHYAWHNAQLKLYLKLMGIDTSKIRGM